MLGAFEEAPLALLDAAPRVDDVAEKFGVDSSPPTDEDAVLTPRLLLLSNDEDRELPVSELEGTLADEPKSEA